MKRKNRLPVDKSTVRTYRHFEELQDCLASGWSVPTVRNYLIERFGPDGVPTVFAVTKWREKHLEVAARVLPHRVIQHKLKGVQFKVDAIGHLSRLVALCEDRVARGIEQEDKFDGMPLAVNDGVMQTYLQALRDYVKVAQDLGILKSRPPVPLIDARQVIITPEILRQLQETVEEIKMMEARGAVQE